ETAVVRGGRGRFRDSLVAVQIAVCLTLLTGAGLFVRGVRRSSYADPGFETKHLFMMELPYESLGNTPAERVQRLEEAMRTLKETPQIQSAALMTFAPLLGHGTGNFQPLASQVAFGSDASRVLYNCVSPDYFQTLGTPLLTGRLFSTQEADLDAPLVVISERAAARFWPGEDPLGKRLAAPKGFHYNRIGGRTFTVIGVVKSVRSVVLSKVDPAYIYFPARCADLPMVLLRTRVPADGAIPAIQEAMRGVDEPLATQMSLVNVETGPVQLQRLMTETPAIVAAVLGVLGLGLATVGIYGVVAYLVSERTREIGVRMAMGACRGDVLGLVFRQALTPVLWGIPMGLAGSTALSVMLRKMVAAAESPDLLFGANPWSPVPFAGMTLMVVFVVWLASWIPALRATRIEPATSLRYE
ncbi:MAG TPA: FtsX-like permease family protein, partial [Blastocatellia bacterium]|nr:FtsX-like permease family protein [Blastocatellia bacterium]